MSTLYLDCTNGNDNYGGTSFALLASGSNGRISSTTFSSSGASFANNGALIGQYLSIYNGSAYKTYVITAYISATSLTIAQISGGDALANQSVDRQYYIGGRWKTIGSGATAARLVSGDTVRIMGSPSPTAVGSASWTAHRSLPQYDFKDISSSTNASPIAVTTSTAHGLTTGDTVFVRGHTTNTNANGVYEVTVTSPTVFTLTGSTGNGVGSNTGIIRKISNQVVRLSAPVTQNIASTGARSAWTASTNVTATLDTTYYREHQYSDKLAIAAAFTTGKAAYYATGTLDLSGYQQVSFYIMQAHGTIGNAASISLKLCTDTTGDTAVHTIDIPKLKTVFQWIPVTVNLGVNLNSAIKSIGFYVNTDNGLQTFYLSNIIAVKNSASADSLSLTSLIGKNVTGESWFPIASINGSRIMLDLGYNYDNPEFSPGYDGTTETVVSYKIDPIIISSDNAALSESGVSFEGGYDSTDMSSQSTVSYLDFRNNALSGYVGIPSQYLGTRDFKISGDLYSIGLNKISLIGSLGYIDGYSHTLTNFSVIGESFRLLARNCNVSNINVVGGSKGLDLYGKSNIINNISVTSSIYGISLSAAHNNTLSDAVIRNCKYGIGWDRGSTTDLDNYHRDGGNNITGFMIDDFGGGSGGTTWVYWDPEKYPKITVFALKSQIDDSPYFTFDVMTAVTIAGTGSRYVTTKSMSKSKMSSNDMIAYTIYPDDIDSDRLVIANIDSTNTSAGKARYVRIRYTLGGGTQNLLAGGMILHQDISQPPSNNVFNNVQIYNSWNFGCSVEGIDNKFNNLTIENSRYATFFRLGRYNYFKSFVTNDSTLYYTDPAVFYASKNGFTNYNGAANNHRTVTDVGTITSTATVTHSSGSTAWQLSPTTTNCSSVYPLSMALGQIAVYANKQVTIKAWLRRNSSNLDMRLKVKGNQLAGISSDITSSLSGAADAWHQVALSFTPTENGVVEASVEAYGGSTYSGYVDDISVYQE